MTANNYEYPGPLSEREHGAVLFGQLGKRKRGSSIIWSDMLDWY